MFGLDNKESAAIFMINIKFLFYRLIFTPVIGMLSFDFDVIGDSCFVFCKSYTYANSRGDSGGGGHPARAPPKIGKNMIFFGVKSWFFTRNIPKIFAPPSARRNFFKCAPPNLKSWIRPWIVPITTNVVSSNRAQARCTRYNIMWSSLSVICGGLVVFSGYPGFLHQ